VHKKSAPPWRFQSTPPERGATQGVLPATLFCQVSIHAPREGSDQSARRKRRATGSFNPRPPRGERLAKRWLPDDVRQFQSTPPERGATLASWACSYAAKFQSTPPERGATRGAQEKRAAVEVSIHAPREGSDFIYLKTVRKS